jgi:hypothetical protein
MEQYQIIYEKMETLRQDEPELFPTESELAEIDDILNLHKMIAEVQESPDCVYYTTT